MKNFYPEVYEQMLMPPSLNKTYNIGMTEKFWVVIDDTLNAGEQIEVQITAQLLAKGTQVAIWADVNEIGLSNTNINATTATEFLAFVIIGFCPLINFKSLTAPSILPLS